MQIECSVMATKRSIDECDAQLREQEQLADTMALDIFGPTPTTLQISACKFVVKWTGTTYTAVSPKAFVDFVKGQLPTTRNADIVWTWTSLRAHISEHGKDPLKEAFKNTALLTLDEVSRLWDAVIATNDADQLPEQKKNKTKRASKQQALEEPSLSPSCSTPSSVRGSRSSSSLSSRACDAESPLHSFVIDNVKTVIQLFAGKDREEVAQVLEDRGAEEQDTKDEQAFMARYLSTPKATGSALGRGWLGSTEEVAALDEDQREWLFKAMHDIYTVYKCCAFRLPLEEKEAWYMTALWSFLIPFFNQSKSLLYRPGEAVSEASAHRRNASRTLENRRSHGHKIDGLILSTMTQLEFGGIEAARTDDGTQSTKAHMDMRKLAKLLKDMHDCIMSKTEDPSARHELGTFGIQITRCKMTIYRLRKVPVDGPHYQLVDLGSYMFPPVWDERGLVAVAITRLLASLVALKKLMEDMDTKIAIWTIPGVRFEHEVLVQTLSSPPRSSDTESADS
ncbi:hypothetical protein KVV02_005056 [Mortierella alpina]|uniref:Uncharacterized protein n=1 Tax=Mortierella alpina TaxID=64518 RepID=A0A9P8CVA6_MORAP|nr:hypothetical protein KVV02_005056 [Mortierella alpina]